MPRAQAISLLNLKGGVGKTTCEAPMESKPIALYDSSASGAEAFRALTEEFVNRLER